MQLHDLKRKIKNKSKKTVGRGGTRGKTSGRGMKGQKARSGNKKRPEYRDIIKKFPKLRGHGKNRAQTVNSSKAKAIGINIGLLNEHFEGGSIVSPQTLVEKGILRSRGGKIPSVKILANGELSKKLEIVNCSLSKQASEKIKSAGGTIKA